MTNTASLSAASRSVSRCLSCVTLHTVSYISASGLMDLNSLVQSIQSSSECVVCDTAMMCPFGRTAAAELIYATAHGVAAVAEAGSGNDLGM